MGGGGDLGGYIASAVQLLTAPGGLPELRVIGRGTQANLLVELKPPIWLRKGGIVGQERRRGGERREEREG